MLQHKIVLSVVSVKTVYRWWRFKKGPISIAHTLWNYFAFSFYFQFHFGRLHTVWKKAIMNCWFQNCVWNNVLLLLNTMSLIFISTLSKSLYPNYYTHYEVDIRCTIHLIIMHEGCLIILRPTNLFVMTTARNCEVFWFGIQNRKTNWLEYFFFVNYL